MFIRKKIIVLMALIIALVIAGIPAVWAQDPTIPTRTPTPDPNQPGPQPTDTPDDPGVPPPPEATEPSSPDPGPGDSPTATPAGGGSVLPTATTAAGAPGAGPETPGSGTPGAGQQPGPGIRGTCDETPYVKAIEAVIIYAGPGDDYDEVAELGAEDMRPIIGRGYYAQWWQIQYDRETVGWVADAEVDEYGNTALVPLVVAPEIDGNTPTPGAIWNPTPLPLLTCVPTPTPTPSPSPTATGTLEASLAGGGVTGSEGGGSGSQGGPQPTQTVGMVSAEIEGEAPVTGEEEVASSGTGVDSRGSESSRAASPTSALNLILPLAGLALISGGIVLALASRRKAGAKTDTTDTTE